MQAFFGLSQAFLDNQQVVFAPCNLHSAEGLLFVKGTVFNYIYRTEIVSLQLFNLWDNNQEKDNIWRLRKRTGLKVGEAS